MNAAGGFGPAPCWGDLVRGAVAPHEPRGAGPAPAGPRAGLPTEPDPCDVCGSLHLTWHRCKLICANCRSILKSCADL